MNWLQNASRLLDLGVSPTGSVPARELADAIIDSAVELTNAAQALWLKTDAATLDLGIASARGLIPDTLARLRVRAGQGILGRAALAAKPAVRLALDGEPLPDETFLVAPYAFWPLHSQGRLLGLLVLGQLPQAPLAPETLESMNVLAKLAARLFENQDFFQNLQGAYDESIEALTQSLRAKEKSAPLETEPMRLLVRALGEQLHVPKPLLRSIEQGALLHDIGKIGIPDAILNKPGALTPEEYTVVKTHPEIGYRILQPVAHLRAAAAIVLYHQEWFNGQGYPENLAGEEIPLGARLVAILDAWNAMTSDRPYRKAMTPSAALVELRKHSGTQFDPQGIDAFMKVQGDR